MHLDYLTFISLPLALILGFVIHRSGLCMVRTVAEIYTRHRAYMLAGILKSVLWVLTVLLVWTFLQLTPLHFMLSEMERQTNLYL